MSRTDLDDLAGLTGMLYRVEQARMQTLTQEETRLRHALKVLEERRKSALALPPDALQAPRRIGADLLWQSWVARNREEINRQLALVLARKARQLDALRRAYGRDQATQSLSRQDQATRNQAKARRNVVEEQALSLLKTSLK